jgi:hypothetical protein
MTGFWNLNLIHFLDFYFTFFFFANTFRRFEQYRAVGSLILASPARWPRLLNLVKEHRAMFLTATTLWPGLLALVLSLLQILASRLVWPEAGEPPHGLTVEILAAHWQALAVVLPAALATFTMDVYSLVVVAKLDNKEMEKYFDQAEYWLRSRTAHVIRIFTLGRIDPRNMVAVEVRKALTELTRMLNYTLWWVTVQVGLRLIFGLSLWLSWVWIG